MKFYVSSHNTKLNTAGINKFETEREAFDAYFACIKLKLAHRFYTLSKGPTRVILDSRELDHVH